MKNGLLVIVLAATWLSTPVFAAQPTGRLTVLVDNAVSKAGVRAEWGFSCLVEAHGHAVLLDTGPSPELLRGNMAALAVDPARIEAVVFSHSHSDHTLGAPAFAAGKRIPVYTPHRFLFQKQTLAALEAANLDPVPLTESRTLFDGITVSEPVPFTKTPPSGTSGSEPNTEKTEWEQALVVDTPEGLVVIVGCAHPGIMSMLEQVKRQRGRPIHTVIGGFHLLHTPAADVRVIAEAMKALGVASVGATHCTGADAAAIFRDVFGDRYINVAVGTVIVLP
jgi:7,8-dihydropterin-6-yl-methyl-4-(beta-D-ribofuranosyl)aminobenzene 5'-phosphate synthase